MCNEDWSFAKCCLKTHPEVSSCLSFSKKKLVLFGRNFIFDALEQSKSLYNLIETDKYFIFFLEGVTATDKICMILSDNVFS